MHILCPDSLADLLGFSGSEIPVRVQPEVLP
jgi:hypothetical protein